MEEDFSKRYYKIKDVAEYVGVPESTLRFWEKEFPEIAPTRSNTNRRLYTPADIKTFRILYYLVKTKGLKIQAAKEQLRSNKANLSKRIEIIDDLNDVKSQLTLLLKSLEKRSRKPSQLLSTELK